MRKPVAKLRQVYRGRRSHIILVLPAHRSQGPCLGPSQLPDRIHLIAAGSGLVLHLLADILCNVTSRVISPPDRSDQDVVHCTPNGSKNPGTTTAGPSDDDSPDNDGEEDSSDTDDEEQHEKKHGDRTKDSVQWN